MHDVHVDENVCEDHTDRTHRDDGYQTVFLAKNKTGYQNLIKMCSLGYTDGFYYVPRVDKKIVENFKGGLIVLSGDKYGEVSNKILNVGENQAEDALMWWKSIFKDDYYLELNRHGEEEDDIVNQVLLKFSKNCSVKVVATNSSKYINKEDIEEHSLDIIKAERHIKELSPDGSIINSEIIYGTEDHVEKAYELYQKTGGTSLIYDQIAAHIPGISGAELQYAQLQCIPKS